MITFKELQERLDESKQVGRLYHYTTPKNALDILQSNSLGKGGLIKGNSFTRNKNFHKDTLDYTGENGPPERLAVPVHVSFELDGNKLSNNHKISPTNDYRNAIGRYRRGAFGYSTKPNESEEHTRQTISNIKSYISKIRIHHPVSEEHLKELESHGIPIEHTYKESH